jgi:hypothetical protein
LGTLRSYEWIEVFDDEGNLIEKKSAAEGLVVNGVLLGIPLEIDGDPATAEFDDSAFVQGIILADGTIIPDEDDEVVE